MNNFQNKYSFDKRKEESDNVIEKYPDRIPIIVQKHKTTDLPEVDKCKYLVPKSMSITQFSFIIRKRIKLEPSQAIFISINNKLVGSSKTISELYHEEKNDDGFLYIIYTGENTFG
tara:strand:- start:2906 stop:3253 length:348 start_codon:yes stop_codon:yes gene_type:complete